MRIKIDLEAINDSVYDNYFYEMHGLISNILYDNINSTGRKYFSYSTLFPIGDTIGIKKQIFTNDKKSFVIASPDEKIINKLYKSLERKIDKEIIYIGSSTFIIRNVKHIKIFLKSEDVIFSQTPIVLDYINTSSNRKEYWGSKYGNKSIEYFKKLLVDSMYRFMSYYVYEDTSIYNRDVFKFDRDIEDFNVKYICAIPIKQFKNNIIGTICSFKISKEISEPALRFLQFFFDAGFGSKNGLGFGFMNR